MNQDLTKEDFNLLPCYCFDIIISFLKDTVSDNSFPSKFRNKEYPLFVTWTSGRNKELRGCLGTFESECLEDNLTKFALFSAFKDSRFSPIGIKDILKLDCGVSLLINFEIANDVYDWQIGIHGIIIDLDYKGFKYHATFLPEIPFERNWDKSTTILLLLRKSGYYGSLYVIENQIKLTRFNSIKSNVSYLEYQTIKLNNNNIY
jgi:uncharacterized protein (TIGR00296 family)